MKPRTAHLLRSQQTLLVHELREQGPMGLCVLAAGAAILFSVRFASGVQTGDVGAQLPHFVPALAALLLAFPAADLLGRDARSGLARTLAAAPVERVRLLAPRLVVFMLVVTIVVASLLALEPPRSAFNIRTTGASLVALMALLVCVALSGAVLPSAIAALITGVVVCCGALVGLTLMSRWSSNEPDLTAAAQVFAQAFTGSLSVATLLPSGLAAVFIAWALRGPGARRWTRRLRGALLAAMLFVAPPSISAALATHATLDVEFDEPGAIVRVSTDTETGQLVLHLTAQARPWTSSWSVDPDTGATRRRRALPWHAEPLLDTAWLSEPMRGSHEGVEARFAFANGTTTDWLWMHRHSWPGRTSPRDRVVYISAASTLAIVSLVDGGTTSLHGIPELDFVLYPRLSPDGRWIALDDWVRYDPEDRGRGYHRTRLVDAASGEVVQSIDSTAFLGWQTGPLPLVVVNAPNGRFRRDGPRYLALGPDGSAPVPVDEDVLALEPLTGDRFVCTTYDMRVLVMRVDGTLERTLRAPRPVAPR
jgi:hypothetical protein